MKRERRGAVAVKVVVPWLLFVVFLVGSVWAGAYADGVNVSLSGNNSGSRDSANHGTDGFTTGNP